MRRETGTHGGDLSCPELYVVQSPGIPALELFRGRHRGEDGLHLRRSLKHVHYLAAADGDDECRYRKAFSLAYIQAERLLIEGP